MATEVVTESSKKKKIQSSIASLSVGDERKCFNQIRKAAGYIEQDSLLWNGWTAGKFALEYVIGHHMKRKQKAEEKMKTSPSASKEERVKKRRGKRSLESDKISSLENGEANTESVCKTDALQELGAPSEERKLKIHKEEGDVKVKITRKKAATGGAGKKTPEEAAPTVAPEALTSAEETVKRRKVSKGKKETKSDTL